MKLSKFTIPVGISLAAFIYGYRGELWLGKVTGSSEMSATAIDSSENNSKKSPNVLPTTVGGAGNHFMPGPPPDITPTKARELPLTTPSPGEEYAPEDDGEEEITEDGDEEVGDEEGVDQELDQADDQSLPEDEPGADSPENEEVDLDSNEGDLEENETADTAETKPVKP